MITFVTNKQCQPLVRPEACVCEGQQRSQSGVQLIQLHRKLSEAIVLLLVHWHGVYTHIHTHTVVMSCQAQLCLTEEPWCKNV